MNERARRRFPAAVLATLAATKYQKVRCGDHRFVAVWVVVVDGRVFARSWNDKPAGWRSAFLAHPDGALLVDGKEVGIRARPLRAAKPQDAIDAAYAAKFTTKANLHYVRGLCDVRRRATTMEFLPATVI